MTKLILHLGKNTKMILELRYLFEQDCYIVTDMYMRPYYGGNFDLNCKSMIFFNALSYRNSGEMTSKLFLIQIKQNHINIANRDIYLIDLNGSIINRFDNISPNDIELLRGSLS
jgi:hypothetical protein